MTEAVIETKESPSYQLRTRDKVVAVWITILILLSVDDIIFNWLPNYISGARYPLLFFITLVPSRSSYKITRIPEFLVLFFSTLFLTVQLVMSYFAGDTPFLPPETYDDAMYRIIGNMIFISLIIPWLWLAYRRFENKSIQWILFVSTIIVYPLALITQFSSEWAEFTYLFAIVFMAFWLIISSLQVKLLYPSTKAKIGNFLILAAFLSIGLSFLVLAFVRTSTTLTLAHLGIDLWIYILYVMIALFSEVFILTEHQTLSAVRTYYEVKSHEVGECIVFANLDTYLREIPEDIVLSIDNEELTLVWIGLQRTTT